MDDEELEDRKNSKEEKDRKASEELEEDRGIEVLKNNRQVQAVRDQESGMVQALFYHAGEVDILDGMKLSLDSPGAVMLKIKEGKVKEITVAEVARRLRVGESTLYRHLPGGRSGAGE